MRDYPLVMYIGTGAPRDVGKVDNFQEVCGDVLSFFPTHLSQSRQFPKIASSLYLYPTGPEFTVSKRDGITQKHMFNFADLHGRLISQKLISEDAENEVYGQHCLFALCSEPIAHQLDDLLSFYLLKCKSAQDLLTLPEIVHGLFNDQRRLPITVHYGCANVTSIASYDNSQDLQLVVPQILTRGLTPYPTFPQMLFKTFDAQTVAAAIEAVLMEKTVIFVANDQFLVGKMVFDLLSLLHPFPYSYPWFTCLPRRFLTVLHSPIPVIGGVTYQTLIGSVLPPSIFLLDIGQRKLVQLRSFKDYQVQIRFAVPRSAINQLKNGFLISYENDADEQLNTYNYSGSDRKASLSAFAFQKIVTEKKLFKTFDKIVSTIPRAPQDYQEQSSSLSDAPANIKHLIPGWFCYQTVATIVEVNQRLSYLDAKNDLGKQVSSQEIQLQKINQTTSLIESDTEQSEPRPSMGRTKVVQMKQEPIFAPIQPEKCRQYAPLLSTKEYKTIKFDVKPYEGQLLYKRPCLPQRIRNSIAKVIQQTVVLTVQDIQETEVLPHPLAVLIDRKLQLVEYDIYGMKDKKLTDDQVRFLDQILTKSLQAQNYQVEFEGCNSSLVDESLQMMLVPFFETLGVPFLPSFNQKRIEATRLKIGVMIQLLQLVKHFKRAIKPNFSREKKPSVVQFKPSNQEIAVNFRNLKVVGKLDTYESLCKGLLSDACSKEFTKDQGKFSFLFDYSTFIAEAPIENQQFLLNFSKSKMFDSFLLGRLLEEHLVEGQSFFGYSVGQNYGYKHRLWTLRSSMDASMMPPSMSLGRQNIRMSMDMGFSMNNMSQVSATDSSPDSPLHEPSTDMQAIDHAPIAYLPSQYDELLDAADYLLRYEKILSKEEQDYFNKPEHLFAIKKPGDKAGSWNDRLLLVDKSKPSNIILTWYNQSESRGSVVLDPRYRIQLAEQPGLPTPFQVGIQVRNQNEAGARHIVQCFHSAEDMRRFLFVVKAPAPTGTMKVQPGIAQNQLLLLRKQLRYAVGNFFYRLHMDAGCSDDFILQLYGYINEVPVGLDGQ